MSCSTLHKIKQMKFKILSVEPDLDLVNCSLSICPGPALDVIILVSGSM